MLTEGSANAGIIASAISRQTHIITSELARADRRVEETAAAWSRAYNELAADYDHLHAELQEVIRRHNLLADKYNDLHRCYDRSQFERDHWERETQRILNAFQQAELEHKARVHEMTCKIARLTYEVVDLRYQLPRPDKHAINHDDTDSG